MELYIKQLMEACRCELYYLTLIGTLSLIDICGAINSRDGESSKNNFIEWFNNYLSNYSENDNATSLYAEECYKLRCRLLHQGVARFDTDDFGVKLGSVVFMINPRGVSVHKCNFNGFYYLDIETFMNDVISGVYKNIQEKKDDPIFNANKEKMIKITDKDPGRGIGKGLFMY